MSAPSPIPRTIPFRTLDRVSGAVWGLVAVLVLIGAAAAFLAAGEAHGRVWQALLFNWLFWSSLAMGMVMLAVAWQVVEAEWPWSIRRFALGGVSFLPVSLVLFPVIFFGGKEYFFHHWLHVEGDPVIDAKRAWLNVPGMFTRDIVALLVLYGMALAFAYFSLRPDVYGAGRNDGQRSLYARLTGGWRGAAEEAGRSRNVLLKLGVFMGLAYALFWGLIAIDTTMTMLPHWFSTMYPVAFFMAAFLAGICGTAVAVTLFRRRLGIEQYVTARQYHDLGKLIFAFAVFWMYLNWSQYVVIWYGMLPFEQEWFVKRFEAPFTGLAQAVPLLIFVVPFLGLLSRTPKKVPTIVAGFATLILVGIWLERYMLVYPSLYEAEEGVAHHLPFGLPEIGIGLGFLGLFLACYLWYLRSFPILPSPATLAARPPSVIEVPAATAHAGH
ncbi:MAG TPA: hypothetical protein VHG51_20160 [Longimicrobiaceae bacterium]|nr:hypothetical protein [Longimicrobiaceae bacterium]